MDVQRMGMSSVIVLDNHTPEDVAKAMIEGQQKEPFYIFNMDEVYRRVEYFRKMMPRVEMFYGGTILANKPGIVLLDRAQSRVFLVDITIPYGENLVRAEKEKKSMKANDSDKMIKLAAALGLGFDCASPGEIRKVLELGVSPQSIIFAAPTKTPDWMMYARQSGVRHATFDSSYELKKIRQNWPNAGLLIRIKVDSDSIYKLGDKFGCDFETEATELLDEAASLGLKVVGVAFHVGSSCFSPHSHVVGLQNARALFDYEVRAGRGMSIVDIGGGFLSDRADRIDQVSKLINTTLEELFPEPSVQIIAEPGRYLCDTACKLYCSINNIRRVTRGGEKVNMIYMNDGLFGSLRYNEFWQKVERFAKHESITNEKLEKTILWGPSCDSTDRVMQNVEIMLPACTPLDWLVFNSQGAYAYGFASQFSCLPKPQMRSVVSRQLWEKLKDSTIFSPDDFEHYPDISAPLPSSLPPLIETKTTYVKSNTLKTN